MQTACERVNPKSSFRQQYLQLIELDWYTILPNEGFAFCYVLHISIDETETVEKGGEIEGKEGPLRR